jgi:peroxiredoxin (alkyl hydroperoxide reductase subunit C)
MSLINTEIKPFATTAYKDGKFVDVSSEDLAGKWAVFMFYPADFTFVCPTELADLADKYAELQAMGVEVFSVSTDTHFVHKAWHDSSAEVGKVNYFMLGDPSGEIARNFDTLRPSGLADRSTFIVDNAGVIQSIETTAEGIGRNATELVRKVKAAQYVASHPGEVCPAKWEEGAATLAPSIDLVGQI